MKRCRNRKVYESFEQTAAEPLAKRTATSPSTVPTSDTESVEVSTSAAGAGGSTSSIATCAAPVAVPATAFDITELLRGGLCSNEKQMWLASCFQPDTNFDFQPRSSRKFRYAWLEKYRWLRYSPSKSGAFCINCLLFGKKNSEREQLVSSARTNFHKAASALERHVTQASHCLATSDLAIFLAAASCHAGSVQTRVISGAAQIRAQNRAKLRMIVKTLLFCGRQNIPLRGHREPATRDLDLATLPVDSNPGNFLALLHLLASSGS